MTLTDRDKDIIGFVLNMKFASVTDIHHKFFRHKKDGGTSKSEWYARERLRELMLCGYLNIVSYRFEMKNYYVGTKHGYDLCRFGADHTDAAKPISQIDIRTFDHDQKVMQSRLVLEDQEKVSNWVSDRQLKGMFFDYFSRRGTRDSAPDGVYKSLAGKTIAFEYEIAQKSKKRYEDKIRRYVDCFRQSQFDDRPKYDHVRIICEKESVYKLLLDSTTLWRELFTVELAESFFNKFKLQPMISHPPANSFDVMQ